MANEEQLSILKQGVEVWNKWRKENPDVEIDLSGGDLGKSNLFGANLNKTKLREADLSMAHLFGTTLRGADLRGCNLGQSVIYLANLHQADFTGADLSFTNLSRNYFLNTNFSQAKMGYTVFGNSDLSQIIGLEDVKHVGPSSISTDTFAISKGQIPEAFLQGCGLSDADIEYAKLSKPDWSNDEINKILYKIYDLRATQALQISPLFISYSHGDSVFVDKLESQLNEKGIRFWRDIHEMKAGRIETQIDRAISQNRTVLLVLSENSIKSDWVEHEVRTARGLEKEIGRDILCPIALDDSWNSSSWPKRVMEQIMEYNILDFSAWEDDVKFDEMFRKLIDGLELFYKG